MPALGIVTIKNLPFLPAIRRGVLKSRRVKINVIPDKDLAVRLDDDDVNRAVRVSIETIERGLPAHRGRAGREQSRNGKHDELVIVALAVAPAREMNAAT